jgi:hypothetical protein
MGVILLRNVFAYVGLIILRHLRQVEQTNGQPLLLAQAYLPVSGESTGSTGSFHDTPLAGGQRHSYICSLLFVQHNTYP